jgi:hypothetical protein
VLHPGRRGVDVCEVVAVCSAARYELLTNGSSCSMSVTYRVRRARVFGSWTVMREARSTEMRLRRPK